MRYTVILEREADGGYLVSIPALPGCISQGTTAMKPSATSGSDQTLPEGLCRRLGPNPHGRCPRSRRHRRRLNCPERMSRLPTAPTGWTVVKDRTKGPVRLAWKPVMTYPMSGTKSIFIMHDNPPLGTRAAKSTSRYPLLTAGAPLGHARLHDCMTPRPQEFSAELNY